MKRYCKYCQGFHEDYSARIILGLLAGIAGVIALLCLSSCRSIPADYPDGEMEPSDAYFKYLFPGK